MEISNRINSYTMSQSMSGLNQQSMSGISSRQPKVSKALSENRNLSVDLFQRVNSNQSFKGVSMTEIFMRHMINDIFRMPAERILEGSNDFTMTEYKSLSAPSKAILRQFLPCPQSDIDELLYMYKVMRDNLKEKFPSGYTLVSIGRSPSVLAKLHQSQGEDVILCPMSELNHKGILDFVRQYIEKYRDYMSSVGLTEDLIFNCKNPLVFVDFTDSGKSLSTLEEIFKSMGNLNSQNTHFLSLNKDLVHAPIKTWLKVYSPIRRANPIDIIHRKDIILNYQLSKNAKLMQFHLIDRLEREKG